MNPWFVILLIAAAVVFGLDYLIRRKKWQDNTKDEKISLLVNMFSVGPYVFLSALGMLWGIAGGSPATAFGEMLYEVTLILASIYFIIALVAVILSFVLRKTGKSKASIWTNIIALLYIVVVLVVNGMAGAVM